MRPHPGRRRRPTTSWSTPRLMLGYCGYHAVGTCRMGRSDDDVIDDRLRLLEASRVRIDELLKIMPTMQSRAT